MCNSFCFFSSNSRFPWLTDLLSIIKPQFPSIYFSGSLRDWLKKACSPPLAAVIGYRTMFPNRDFALDKTFLKKVFETCLWPIFAAGVVKHSVGIPPLRLVF